MDEITDPFAVAALTEGYFEVGTGDDLRVVTEPGFTSEEVLIHNDGVLVDSTAALGVSLIREYMLAFEIIGLLLVATLIGGLLLMRDPPSSDEDEADAQTGGASV
jgi:hypothetical protein